MAIIGMSKIKEFRKHDFALSVFCNFNFFDFSKKINTKPRKYFYKYERGWCNKIYLKFSSGRLGTMTQWEEYPGAVEINLELTRGLFVYEDDLIEILELIDQKIKDVVQSKSGIIWKKKK